MMNKKLFRTENQIQFFQMIAFLVLEDISFKSEESGGIYIIEMQDMMLGRVIYYLLMTAK